MKKLKLAVAASLAVGGAVPATAQGMFKGKTIEVVVPFGEGGATFVSAKFLEPYFEKHLPGYPSLDIVSRPGGGS